MVSQKFLHTKIIKAASDDFHAVMLGLSPNETEISHGRMLWRSR